MTFTTLIRQAVIQATWLPSVSAEQRVGAASHAEGVESRRTIMRWSRRSGYPAARSHTGFSPNREAICLKVIRCEFRSVWLTCPDM